MKTGTISQGNMTYTQTKPLAEEKAARPKEQAPALEDKVDLSGAASASSTPVPSYADAMNMIKNLDFPQAMDAHKISREAAGRFMELLQLEA